jgi:hypothetical protein
MVTAPPTRTVAGAGIGAGAYSFEEVRSLFSFFDVVLPSSVPPYLLQSTKLGAAFFGGMVLVKMVCSACANAPRFLKWVGTHLVSGSVKLKRGQRALARMKKELRQWILKRLRRGLRYLASLL